MAELSMRRNVYSARGDFGFGGFQAPTGSMTAPGTGGTLANILSAAAAVLPGILGPRMAPQQQFLPALGPVAGAVGRAVLPAIGVGAGAGMLSLLGGNGGGDAMFTASGAPRNRVAVTSPVNGRMYWIGNLGAPILYRGDLRARDRVNDVARLAARGRSRRSRRRFR